MPGIFKKLSANDIKITPFEAHKQYTTTDLTSIGARADFVSWVPYNKFYFNDGNRKYYQIDKLYYRNYIHERANRLELDDATYTTQERRLYDSAQVISLSQKTFGSEIQPGSFILSSSYSSSVQSFTITDDGFGNLYDSSLDLSKFSNEDNRVLYLSPLNAFKIKEDIANIDYKRGNRYVNAPFANGFTGELYDDSYFCNSIKYNKVKFTDTDDLYGSTSVKAIGPESKITIFHQPQFNFEKEDAFSISFYYDPIAQDFLNAKESNDFYILSKESLKTSTLPPSEGTQHTPLSRTGSSQLTTVPVGEQFPYRIYYKGAQGSGTEASLFVEMSDGETTKFVSQSFFGQNNTGSIFVHVSHTGISGSEQPELYLSCDGSAPSNSQTQNSPYLTKTTSNKADINLYSKPNPDSSYTNHITGDEGGHSGQISQLQIWADVARTDQSIISVISSSITGTPNVGNIFYDNGFAVITHPKYRNVLRHYDILRAEHQSSSDVENLLAGFNTNHSSVPSGIAINGDGTRLFTIGTDEIIQFYDLSTPYDLSTASTGLGSLYNISINGGSTNPLSMEFNNDGTRVFISTYNGDSTIYEIKLNVPYEFKPQFGLFGLGNIVPEDHASSKFDFGFEYVKAINFSQDGSKLILLDNENDLIKRYTLPTPFSLAPNPVLDQSINALRTPTTTGTVQDLVFSHDGYKMFVIVSLSGNTRTFIDYYELNTPWDLDSARFISIRDFQTGVSSANFIKSIVFNPEGDKFFTLQHANFSSPGNASDVDVAQYNINRDIGELKYKNTHLINENEYQCTMTEDEFEFTTNLSARKIPFSDSEDIANFTTGSDFKPYITSIGLYDNDGNLLVVGKLGQPIKASSETDTTFTIRFDT